MCITWIIHQQRLGYKFEKKLHLGIRRTKKVDTPSLESVDHNNRVNSDRGPQIACRVAYDREDKSNFSKGHKTADDEILCNHRWWNVGTSNLTPPPPAYLPGIFSVQITLINKFSDIFFYFLTLY
jgi:hypothetical protein